MGLKADFKKKVGLEQGSKGRVENRIYVDSPEHTDEGTRCQMWMPMHLRSKVGLVTKMIFDYEAGKATGLVEVKGFVWQGRGKLTDTGTENWSELG